MIEIYTTWDGLESGGILLGHGEPQCYTSHGPADERLPGMFTLCDPQHQAALDASDLDYLGFWHSHPPGNGATPSQVDTLDWIEDARSIFPQQPHVPRLYYCIVCGEEQRWYHITRDHPEEVKHG